MCFNSELRSLYDIYAAKHVLWLHSGAYAQARELRPAFGLLSMQLWQLVHDSGLLDVSFTLHRVAAATGLACKPPPCVAARRRRVALSHHAPGIWTFTLPEMSPFQVCCSCILSGLPDLFWALKPDAVTCTFLSVKRAPSPCMQELTYPEFCETLVRVATIRLSSVVGLDERVRALIQTHLLPLLQQRAPSAMQELLQSTAFAQYFQGVDPVMRIVFAAVASKAPVCT
jgi:hypothetical protein